QQVPAAALARSVACQDFLGTNPGAASFVLAFEIRAALYEPSRRRETAVPVTAGGQSMHWMQNYASGRGVIMHGGSVNERLPAKDPRRVFDTPAVRSECAGGLRADVARLEACVASRGEREH